MERAHMKELRRLCNRGNFLVEQINRTGRPPSNSAMEFTLIKYIQLCLNVLCEICSYDNDRYMQLKRISLYEELTVYRFSLFVSCMNKFTSDYALGLLKLMAMSDEIYMIDKTIIIEKDPSTDELILPLA